MAETRQMFFIDVSKFRQQFHTNRRTEKEKEPIKSDYGTGGPALFPEGQDLTP